jgi:hypothetical protein
VARKCSSKSPRSGGAASSVRPVPRRPDDVDVTINDQGAHSRSRWPIPWAIVLIVATTAVRTTSLHPYFPWMLAGCFFFMLLWLGLFELHLGRTAK